MGYEREQVEALFRAVQQSAGQQLGELYKHGKDYLKQLENEWTWTKSGAAYVFLPVHPDISPDSVLKE